MLLTGEDNGSVVLAVLQLIDESVLALGVEGQLAPAVAPESREWHDLVDALEAGL